MDWKRFKEKFETWPANPISDAILLALNMYITNLGYLEDEAPCGTELLNGGTEELDLRLGLDHATTIPDNNDGLSPDLSDLEAKRAKKKVEKVLKRQQRKITLAKATSSADVGIPSIAIVSGLLSIVPGSGLLFALLHDTSANIGASSTASHGLLSSTTSGVDLISVVSGGSLLSPVIDGIGSASAVSGSGPLFLIAGGVGFTSATSGNGLLSPIASGVDFASIISGDSLYSFVAANDGSLNFTISSASLSASSPALSLFGTLF